MEWNFVIYGNLKVFVEESIYCKLSFKVKFKLSFMEIEMIDFLFSK